MSEAPARQSLPPISEVIYGARSGDQHPPLSHSGLCSVSKGEGVRHHDRSLPLWPSSGSLPSVLSSSRTSTCEAAVQHSPRPLNPGSSPSRQDDIPVFTDRPRPPLSVHPSLPPLADCRHTPFRKADSNGHHHAVSDGHSRPPAPTSDLSALVMANYVVLPHLKPLCCPRGPIVPSRDNIWKLFGHFIRPGG